jgi:RND family efflux transporter MFP subunit
VNEPATVAAENNVTLSFQEAGEITAVNVNEGDTVNEGTILASLSTSSLEAAYEQANASLAAAQANLGEIASGTRPQQLAIDQTSVANAAASLSASVQGAYTAASDAVTNQTDNLFSGPQTNGPVFLVPNTNSQLTTNIETQRVAIGEVLNSFYAALNSTSSNPSSLFTVADNSLTQVQSYLDAVAMAVTDVIPGSSLSTATLAQYKADVGTARTEVGAATTALAGADSGYTSAEGALTLAEAGATPQDIEAQEAVVLQAQAAETSAQVALSNASLVAPFPGTVQDLTAQLGQVVSPSVPVLTLVNNGGLKIITYVSEADVAKIAVGDSATITLDAFGTGTTFPATVTTIDTTETSVNGTPSYQVTLHFTAPQGAGNVDIVAAEHDKVVEVPSLLVINNGGQYFVLVPSKNGSGSVQQQVTIGLTGDNGMTEITSGLSAGAIITNF